MCVLLSIVSANSFSRDLAENVDPGASADLAGSLTLSVSPNHRGVTGASATVAGAGGDSTSSTLASRRMFIAEFLVFSVEPSAPPDFMSALDRAVRGERKFQMASARNWEQQGYIRMWGNPRVMGRMGGSAGVDQQIGAGRGGESLRLRCAFEPADTPAEVRCIVTMVYLDRGSRAANVREVMSVAPGDLFHFVKLFRFAPAAAGETVPWVFLLKIKEVDK